MKLSLKTKTILMIILFAVALGAVSLIVSGRVIRNVTKEMREAETAEVVSLISKAINANEFAKVKTSVLEIYANLDPEERVGSEDWGSDEWNAYTALYDGITQMPEYVSLREWLRDMQSVVNVECLYLAFVDAPSEAFIYVLDAAEEDPCPPGCIDPLYEANYALLSDPSIGLPPYTTDTEEYGWLITAGSTVFDSGGAVIGYVLADVSMNDIRHDQFVFSMRLLAFIGLTIVLICAAGLIIIEFALVRPMKKLTDAASNYRQNESNSLYYNNFRDLKIKTGDDIEELAVSMKQMENDLNDHISSLISANRELSASKLTVSELNEMANTDPLTGIRNKRAFDIKTDSIEEELAKGPVRFGIAVLDLNFLKKLNDTYGHEVGDRAISSLSRVICETFAHSPVYRIGGDEFAVILQNADYDNSEALIKKFNDRIKELGGDDSLSPGERISAAIGYSEYDADLDGTSTSEVFRRADHAMYENKKAMKKK